MNKVELSAEYGGRTLTLETGNWAKQSDGAIVCRYGETVVLAAVVSAHETREGQDFFVNTIGRNKIAIRGVLQ